MQNNGTDMKKIVCFLFLINVFYAYSLQWPVENMSVTSTFAERRGDHYHSGIDIGGGNRMLFLFLTEKLSSFLKKIPRCLIYRAEWAVLL